MTEIPMTKGYVALVDDADVALVSEHRWYPLPQRKTIYAQTPFHGQTLLMHRLLLGLTKGDGLQGDHIDGNGLDNQRFNLRVATVAQNHQNQALRIPSHGYLGITPVGNRWQAQIGVRYLGLFPTPEAAALAYDRAAIAAFGEFARPNFPVPV